MSVRRRIAAVAASPALVAGGSACATGPERSEAAFCERVERFWSDLAAADRAAGSSVGAQSGLLLSQAGEFGRALRDLAEVAPEEIRRDTEEAAKSYEQMMDQMRAVSGGSASGMLFEGAGSAMSMMLMMGMDRPVFSRVDAYSQSRCGTLMFGG